MITLRSITLIVFCLTCSSITADDKGGEQASPLQILLRGEAETELAPHGKGNVYAPDVMKYEGKYLMWYGGQGKDGHDRIHMAESADGVTWKKLGVVLDNLKANHVNDPSVIRGNNVFYMYYTQADEREFDQIHVATSNDGIHWIPDGIAIPRGNPGDWDAKVVGRPSAYYDKETEKFHLYYDGRNEGERSVGHAISDDGIHWTKSPAQPLFGHNAGGIDVHRVGKNFVMLYESREGTFLATSQDGLAWKDHGLWIPISKTPADAFGQVTPFLLLDDQGDPTDVYFGAAGRTTWDENSIGMIKIDRGLRRKLESVLRNSLVTVRTTVAQDKDQVFRKWQEQGEEQLLKKWQELPIAIRDKIEEECIVGENLGLSSTGRVELIGVYDQPLNRNPNYETKRLFHLQQTDLGGRRLFWSVLLDPDELKYLILFRAGQHLENDAPWLKFRNK